MMLVITKYDEKLKPLHALVKSGDCNGLKKWIDGGEPLFNPETKSRSVLYYAASSGFFSILELLLIPGWETYQKALDQALRKAVGISHADCVRLLLEYGADTSAVYWDEIFYTHSGKIASLFFEYGKNVDDFESALGCIERGTAGVLKNYLPMRQDLEEPILRKMLEYQSEINDYVRGFDPPAYITAEEAKKNHAHYGKLFGLLRWTGVNTRRIIKSRYGEETSVLEQAIKEGSTAQIKSLNPQESDPISQYAQNMEFCDLAKLKFLVKLGFQINDREDNTSTSLLNAIEYKNFSVIITLVGNGAKLPLIEERICPCPQGWTVFS